MAFEWSWIDGNMIRLPKEFSKNKKDRSLPIAGALMDVIERRLKVRRLDCPYVFHRNGKQIRSFRKAFKTAQKRLDTKAGSRTTCAGPRSETSGARACQSMKE